MVARAKRSRAVGVLLTLDASTSTEILLANILDAKWTTATVTRLRTRRIAVGIYNDSETLVIHSSRFGTDLRSLVRSKIASANSTRGSRGAISTINAFVAMEIPT